jgi:hypothetical protein
MRGKIETGGLLLGALDPAGGPSWLATQSYWYGEPHIDDRPMSVVFDVPSTRPVRIILSNWGLLDGRRSRWRIRDLTLGRVAG